MAKETKSPGPEFEEKIIELTKKNTEELRQGKEGGEAQKHQELKEEYWKLFEEKDKLFEDANRAFQNLEGEEEKKQILQAYEAKMLRAQQISQEDPTIPIDLDEWQKGLEKITKILGLEK